MEKRQAKRIIPKKALMSLRPLDPQLWNKFWGGTECSLRDISSVGVGIVSNEPLPEGGCLSIDLRLDKNMASILVFGRIVWVEKEDKNRYRAGICFSWWRDYKDKDMLCDFVDQHRLLN